MAENWWRIDYASYNTVPYLYKFTALVNIHVLFRIIWYEKVIVHEKLGYSPPSPFFLACSFISVTTVLGSIVYRIIS